MTTATSRRTRLGLESLETREVPAYANVVNGVLQVVGDDWHNDATVNVSGSNLVVKIVSTPTSGFSTTTDRVTKTFPASSINSIKFWGYGGDDSFVCNVNLPCPYVDGGTGNDYLEGANAADVLLGRAGNDTLVGYGGNDKLYGEGGNDVLNGGTGSDLLSGGADFDTAYLSQAREAVTLCEAVHITVPGGNPQSTNTCGPNSAWRVMQSHGGTVGLQRLIDSASEGSLVSKWNLGTTGSTLVNAMNSNVRGLGDYRFSLKTRSSLDHMIDFLKEGRPVVAMIQVGGSDKIKIGVLSYTIPKLHWVAVDGFDSARQLIFYTDTNGTRYQQSYGSFNSAFNWNFGTVQNTALQGLGVVRSTFIV